MKKNFYTSFIFSKLIECATKYNFNLFLVGGKVRDILIKELTSHKDIDLYFHNFSSFSIINYVLENCENFDLDFDFTLVNENFYDALYFSEKFKDFLKSNMPRHEFFIKKNQSFLTVNISIKFNNFSISFDIATFRKEIYDYYGALPKVKYSQNILDDTLRRDITINSIYLKLTKDVGIIDELNGINDLKAKIIRLNYKFSLLDDPTRIFRIIKLKSRLKFEFSSATFSELILAKNKKIYKKISNYRIFSEIKKLFSENNETIKNFLKDFVKLDFIKILASNFSKKNYKNFCLDLKNFENLKNETLFLYFSKNFEKLINLVENKKLKNLKKINLEENLWFLKFLIFLKNLESFELKNILRRQTFPFNKFETKTILNLIFLLKAKKNKSFTKNIFNIENKNFHKKDNIDFLLILIVFYKNNIMKEKILKLFQIKKIDKFLKN